MSEADEASADLTPEVEAALVRNHRDFLAFLEKRAGSRALAEDLLQDAFVRARQKAGTVRDPEAIVAWLYRMLRNAVIDRKRRDATAEKALASLAIELETTLETQAPSGELHDAVCRCVNTLASALKPEYAGALARIDVDGVAVKDYAIEAGITSNNAAVRVFRAREALRKQVERSCGTCATHGCLDCTCGGA
ncbi:MAG: sigma-70 family RNA polymerase sigma factor [Sandaracinaceae bacterium]|nr:sigma-70 family RNA polymerase sigma factor [Sandaracinaceae bacterium]